MSRPARGMNERGRPLELAQAGRRSRSLARPPARHGRHWSLCLFPSLHHRPWWRFALAPSMAPEEVGGAIRHQSCSCGIEKYIYYTNRPDTWGPLNFGSVPYPCPPTDSPPRHHSSLVKVTWPKDTPQNTKRARYGAQRHHHRPRTPTS
jgi:hypothetical protein